MKDTKKTKDDTGFEEWYYDRPDLLKEAEKDIIQGMVNEEYIKENWALFKETSNAGIDYDTPEEAISHLYTDLSHMAVCFERLQSALLSMDINRMLQTIFWLKEEYYTTYENYVEVLDEDGLTGLRQYHFIMLESVKIIMLTLAGYVADKAIEPENYDEIIDSIVEAFPEQDIIDADWVLRSIVLEEVFTEFLQIYNEDAQTGERTDFPNIRVAALRESGKDSSI